MGHYDANDLSDPYLATVINEVRAMREIFKESEPNLCAFCGATISKDSFYCRPCGQVEGK